MVLASSCGGLLQTGPSIVDGTVDGPVIVSSLTAQDDTSAAGLEARISFNDSCIQLVAPDSGDPDSTTIAWPSGTMWDPDAENIVLPDGRVISDGDVITGGGASYGTSDQRIIGETIIKAMKTCGLPSVFLLNGDPSQIGIN